MKISISLSFLIFASLVMLSNVENAIGQVVDQRPTLLSIPKLDERPKGERHRFGTKLTVRVSVDDRGNVTSVESIDGPGGICPGVVLAEAEVLRNAARDVAMRAKFTPALIDGKSVASSGIVDVEFPVFVDTASEVPIRSSPASIEPMRENVRTMIGNEDVRGTKEISPRNNGNVVILNGNVADPAPLGPAAAPELAERSVSGGVLNGKAAILPKPTYPAAARAVRASGAVAVSVLIDIGGNVVSANAVSGHPLLRASSRIAACSARFLPTQLSGQPVNVTGVITYNYVP